MALWSHDAGLISSEDLANVYVYTNPIIEEYLEPGAHGRKLFLMGTKGCGKTLLLRKKAYNFWERKKGANSPERFTVAANDDMFEKLNFRIPSLSSFSIDQLKKTKTWVDIWQFALCLFILKKENISLDGELEWIDKKFRKAKRLNGVLNIILKDPKDFLESRYFREIGELLEMVHDISHSFVYFVDQLDQALNSVLLNDEYGLDEQGRSISYLIWQKAQYGFLEASYNLIGDNPHIKIFATARTEALAVESPIAINIRSYCTMLDYSKEELEKIFYQNLSLTPKEYLLGDKYDSLWFRFFGLEKIEHLSAFGADGSKRREKIFDFIVRHTFKRPREIMMIGHELYHHLVLRRKRVVNEAGIYVQNLRKVVNDTANRLILEEYKKEFVPKFDENYFSEAGKSFTSNLMSRGEVGLIDIDTLNYLYRSGLIGVVEDGIQRFEPVSHYIHEESRILPKSEFYLLHPVLDREMQRKYNYRDFLDKTNIIGDGLEFIALNAFWDKKMVGNDLEFYRPKHLPGRNGAKSFRIDGDLEVFFKLIFVDPEIGLDSSARVERVQNAARMMSEVANLHFLDLLENKFNCKFDSWREEIGEALYKYRGKSNYNAWILDYSSRSLDQFTDRMFGRIITAASLIYTKHSYHRISQLIRNFSDYERVEDQDDRSVLKFLRTGFFLDGLKQIAPFAEHERKILRNGLSDFEQGFIERWWSEYFFHDLLVNRNLSIEHQDFLRSTLIK